MPRMLRTHCRRGHEFTPETTYVDRRGDRICRPCVTLIRSSPEALAARRLAEKSDKKRSTARAWRTSERGKHSARTYLLRNKYGWTIEQWDEQFAAQGHRCATCPATKPDKWVMDHDHACCPGEKSCGKCVRGIICRNCNLALGNAKDDPQTLRSMAEYLERHKDKSCPR